MWDGVHVRLTDGRPVGMTRYLTLRWRADASTPYAVEIGGTWLAASAQRSGINREAKLLMLTHAFDEWGVGRVDFKTDARNDEIRAFLQSFIGRMSSVPPSVWGGAAAVRRRNAQIRKAMPVCRISTAMAKA